MDTFSLVQYLPGVNVGPSAPESAVYLPPSPQQPRGEASCGGTSPQNRGALWSQGEREVSVAPTPTPAQKTVEVSQMSQSQILFSMNLLCLIPSTNSNLIASGLKPLQ